MKSNKSATLLHTSAIPVTPSVPCLDAQGIQLFEWSHPLKSHDDCCGETSEARYIWCGCFALAQIESRVGITTFGNSLAFSLSLSIAVVVLGGIFPDYFLFWGTMSMVEFILTVSAVLCVYSFMWLRRTSRARTVVRERFQIPGSKGDDRSVACWHSSRMLRQMVRHLDCESAGTFARVDTLPAYTQ